MIKLIPVIKNNKWLFFTVLLVCFAVSAGVRYQQFEKWKETPSNFFVQERPMMTTLDAPYWLRWAREYNEGVLKESKCCLREYPSQTETFIENKMREKMSVPAKFRDNLSASSVSLASYLSDLETLEHKYSNVPLLSFLIAIFAQYFNYNYYLTGTLLVPVLASLFILPLGVYFFRIGVPLSGLLGGLVGTFSGGYYMRSSIGRIDTDMLNLFFPVLAGLLVLLVSQAKTERSALLYSIAAGLSLFLFYWWYAKAGFIFFYFAVLVFILFIKKFRLHVILLCSFLFVLCVEPANFLHGKDSIEGFLLRYFVIDDASPGILIESSDIPATFPNTFTTISEVNSLKTNKFLDTLDLVFQRIINKTSFAWVGFTAFLILAFCRWKDLLPFAPMLALGLLSFQSSNRFIMYLGPFIGFGLGWLMNIGLDGIFHFIAKKTKEQTRTHKETKKLKTSDSIENTDRAWLNWIRQGTLYLGMGLFFWMISSKTAISFVPGPSIHPRLYATFMEVKKRVPEDAALLTWWDYGYAITDATGLSTFHDGGSQNSPKTFFIARGLISPDQDELYDITQYLATEGNPGIKENNTSPEALLAAVRNPQLKPWDPIYLFFTADMTGKYGAISKLGSWDIVNGGSKPRGYQNLACNKITNEEMYCRGAKIDLKLGKINNQLPLRRLVFVRDGQVIREKEFGHTQGHTLQLLVIENQIIEVQLIDEEVFHSNYNQMFLLGRYSDDLFEETYIASPFSRLYRVKF